MKIYITLDYELFFGQRQGTPENCMLHPTEVLRQITEPLGIRFSNFVDSGYLLALRRQEAEYPVLGEQFRAIASQLKELSELGHGTELHIHPHWEDSFFTGEHWELNTKRYKLSSFTPDATADIVSRYTAILREITGKDPVAYRAGGWSAQPFNPIGKALLAEGVLKDSTVYPGGFYQSEHQEFDFRNIKPYSGEYKFSNDLVREDPDGQFTEIPISSLRVSPLFFWKLAWTKWRKDPRHRSFGDGNAIGLSRSGILQKLLLPSVSVVSIDGFKTSYLAKAFRSYVRNTDNRGTFVIIGHPKAFTPYSMKKLQDFLKATYKEHQYLTF